MKANVVSWLGILLLNAIWGFSLPTRSGRLVAGAGSVVAAVLLLAPFFPGAIRQYLQSAHEYPRSAARSILLATVFLLPGVTALGTPTIAFWILDGRAWLIIAWVMAAAALALHEAYRVHEFSAELSTPSAATLLFLMWCSAFWLSVVSDIGVGRFVFETHRGSGAVCQSDPLSIAFSIWESHPASEHLFLGWRTLESFELREPYANHVHPYMMAMYGLVWGVRSLGEVPLYVASNTTPFFYMLVLLAGVTTLLARAGILRARNSPVRLLLLFMSYGLIITGWRFWNDLYRFSSDNPYPLLLAVLLFVYAFLLQPVKPALATVSACVFVGLSPIHGPMLTAGVLFLFWRRAPTLRSLLVANRIPLIVTLASAIVGVIVYVIPGALIAWKDYTPKGSSLLFRSGLDGDTRYFSNMVQSVLAPCPRSCCWGRSATDLLFPAFIPLAVFGLFAFRGAQSAIRAGHLFLFLCTPYFVSLILFPQSVSIHPYMYDHMLLIPVIVMGVVAMLTPETEEVGRTWLLALLLITSGVLMSNLIGIAQGLTAMAVLP